MPCVSVCSGFIGYILFVAATLIGTNAQAFAQPSDPPEWLDRYVEMSIEQWEDFKATFSDRQREIKKLMSLARRAKIGKAKDLPELKTGEERRQGQYLRSTEVWKGERLVRIEFPDKDTRDEVVLNIRKRLEELNDLKKQILGEASHFVPVLDMDHLKKGDVGRYAPDKSGYAMSVFQEIDADSALFNTHWVEMKSFIPSGGDSQRFVTGGWQPETVHGDLVWFDGIDIEELDLEYIESLIDGNAMHSESTVVVQYMGKETYETALGTNTVRRFEIVNLSRHIDEIHSRLADDG